jgi:hypothetical protein
MDCRNDTAARTILETEFPGAARVVQIAPMHIAVPHHTDKESAKQRIAQRVSQLLAQYGHYLTDAEHHWEGDTLLFSGSARGFKASGSVDVTDTEVIVDGKIPLIAKPFEPRIRSTIEREAGAMFS